MEDLIKYGYKLKNPDIEPYKDLDINDIIKKIIISRKDEDKDILFYIKNTFDLFSNIKDLKDIELAADILIKHIKSNNKILICTDLDCDGMTSMVTSYRSLELLGVSKDRILTLVNRRKDGNSFNPTLTKRVIDLWNKEKYTLMFSCDQGSVNEPQYKEMKEKCGFDIIITDHHQVQYDIYPNSVDAFINPQRNDSTYSKEISGCTVAFLVMVYTYYKLYNTKDISPFYKIFPYPAISIISDVMSCKEPVNRYIYRIGMNEINKLKSNNFRVYRSILNIPGIFTDNDIRMKLTPFINSANRMSIEDTGIDMLIADSKEECHRNAVIIADNNELKKQIVRTITKEALEDLDNIPTDGGIAFKITTDISINGLIAGKIGEVKKIPTICFIESDKDLITGSCRSNVKGFNLLECLGRIKDNHPNVIEQFGGHKDACGCSIYNKKFKEFKDLFYRYSKDMLTHLDTEDIIYVDEFIKETDITPDFINNIRAIAPFGKDWEEPVFLCKLVLQNVITFGNFCKLTFKRKCGGSLTGFYNFGDDMGLTIDNIKTILNRNQTYLVSFKLDISSYQGSYDFSLDFIKISEL